MVYSCILSMGLSTLLALALYVPGESNYLAKTAALWVSLGSKKDRLLALLDKSARMYSHAPSLEEAIAEGVDGLNKTAAERFEKIWDLNDKKIQLKCGEVQRQLEVHLFEL